MTVNNKLILALAGIVIVTVPLLWFKPKQMPVAADQTIAKLANVSDLNDQRSQILVISDLHLGVDDAFAETVKNRPALVNFLNDVKIAPNIKELVIAGDFFDGWFMPMDYSLPDTTAALVDKIAANNQEVVDALNAIIEAGLIKVTYVPGNHDLLFTDADYDRIFPGINQARDVQGLGTYVTGKNSEIVIEHGHRQNIFCAPDALSNQAIAKDSILPPGYFFTRIATSSLMQGQPKDSLNVFPDLAAPDKDDRSQFNAYLYYQAWKNILAILPVNEGLADPVIQTNIDGYQENYAIDDLLPHQDQDGFIDMNLYQGIQDRWDEIQTLNHVTTKVPVAQAILRAAESSFTDDMAKTQYFDVDAAKRIVVFGHSHVGMVRPETNLLGQKTIYANAGTWIDHNPSGSTRTFILISPENADASSETVTYYHYGNDGSVTQIGEGQTLVL